MRNKSWPIHTIIHCQNICGLSRQLQTVKLVSDSQDSCRLSRKLKNVAENFRHVCSCFSPNLSEFRYDLKKQEDLWPWLCLSAKQPWWKVTICKSSRVTVDSNICTFYVLLVQLLYNIQIKNQNYLVNTFFTLCVLFVYLFSFFL